MRARCAETSTGPSNTSPAGALTWVRAPSPDGMTSRSAPHEKGVPCGLAVQFRCAAEHACDCTRSGAGGARAKIGGAQLCGTVSDIVEIRLSRRFCVAATTAASATLRVWVFCSAALPT